jgi:hypothetical protein
MMKLLSRALTSLVVLVLLALTAAACGDDDDPSGSGTASPIASNADDDQARVIGLEAAERYIHDTGIDGHKGELTDPRSCAEVNDKTKGDFCVQEGFSIYAAGLIILRVANADKPDEEVWEMRLVPAGTDWNVTSVEPFPGNE